MFSYEEGDWEIDDHGLYTATRKLLARRGYCCANQCAKCPYINWHDNPQWRPISLQIIRFAKVSTKAIDGARYCLGKHERLIEYCDVAELEYHQEMIRYYTLLLERWSDTPYPE